MKLMGHSAVQTVATWLALVITFHSILAPAESFLLISRPLKTISKVNPYWCLLSKRTLESTVCRESTGYDKVLLFRNGKVYVPQAHVACGDISSIRVSWCLAYSFSCFLGSIWPTCPQSNVSCLFILRGRRRNAGEEGMKSNLTGEHRITSCPWNVLKELSIIWWNHLMPSYVCSSLAQYTLCLGFSP